MHEAGTPTGSAAGPRVAGGIHSQGKLSSTDWCAAVILGVSWPARGSGDPRWAVRGSRNPAGGPPGEQSIWG
jgi:hypothetical protein